MLSSVPPCLNNRVCPYAIDVQVKHINVNNLRSRWDFILFRTQERLTLRLSASPTQLNKEDRSWRVRSKRLLAGGETFLLFINSCAA